MLGLTYNFIWVNTDKFYILFPYKLSNSILAQSEVSLMKRQERVQKGNSLVFTSILTFLLFIILAGCGGGARSLYAPATYMPYQAMQPMQSLIKSFALNNDPIVDSDAFSVAMEENAFAAYSKPVTPTAGQIKTTSQDGFQTLYIQPEAGAYPILKAIEDAKKTIDIQVYMLTMNDIIQALVKAAQRKVTVRIILEKEPFNPGNPSNPIPINLVTYKKFKEAQDRLNDINNFKKLSTHAAKMQFDFKIDLLEKEKALQVLENKRQQIIIFSIIAGLALLAIFTIFIIQRLRITRRQKRIIENQKKLVDQKNEILNQQKEEIEAQRDEIAGQHEIVITQKKHIEEIHTELKDSILYARRIQKAVLPADDLTEMFLANYFILFEPKDIVSGDFYWIHQRNEFLLIAIADCTGHGVPGAFMSMLGISFLNEIAARTDIQTPARALDELRLAVISSLKQNNPDDKYKIMSLSSLKDGMDIAFAAINTKTLELQFAGANNPLWIVKTLHATSPPALQVVSPDKQPIGIHEIMKPFTNYTLQLQKGDVIYMMSDGYESQFGGSAIRGGGKKFLSKNLKKILEEISAKPMPEQKNILDNTIENWKNNYENKYEQTDDITIFGLKI